MNIHQIQMMLKVGCHHFSSEIRNPTIEICNKCAAQAIMYLDNLYMKVNEVANSVDRAISVLEKVEGQSER